MGGWSVFVNILLPFPLAYVVLLSIPLPSSVASFLRKVMTRFVDFVLFRNVVGGLFAIYHLAVFVSIFLFLESSYEVSKTSERYIAAHNTIAEEKHLGLKWRSERNWWIALFSLTMWIILHRFHSLLHEMQEKKRD